MAKKQEKIIETLGNSDKIIVQKSKPLFALWQSDLTLAEFKILDTYLARIDSHKPDKRMVTFEKGELEEKLGVKKINQEVLEERLEHLMGNVVKIPDSDENKGFRMITLFEEAVAEQDDYGLWKVKLECTQKAMKYIFNIENLGYSRYKLRCITSMKSRYTYIMFIYLESRRVMKSWTVPLDELKKILNCTGETYKQFKRFNDLILKKVHKEMLEKTECRYSYEPIKKGRSVVAIRFTLETLPKIELDTSEEELTIEYDTVQPTNLWETPLMSFNFTREQLDELDSVLVSIPESILPDTENTFGDIKLRRYHYMNQKAKELKRISSERNVRNNFAYLKKMIQRDIQ